ncbi:MAG TPA: Sapep family Mn(2+)-dependent dipeptidase [Thermoanaerobaculia bacterium]|jgi:predicted dipeptidase|nr:Sapep family Mn(2+)-dependent dipeptidase [Thermoanaerobaculia bacterium]
MRRALPILSLALLLAAGRASAETAGCKEVDPQLQKAAAALAGKDLPGKEAFSLFQRTAGAAGKDPRFASCLLRRYVIARYGERMVRDLQEIVRFQTFAVEGKENWDLPELVKQRRWLETRARELGLEFKSYDGRVEEITLSGPKPILALLTHGDVEGVEGQQWSSPPFEARLVNGRIIGRGTEDDKGPIVAALYVLAALRDSGWPLDSTLKLLVANGEETSWAEIPYYLERAPKPERTIGLDAAYPVTHSQKGYGILTFRAQPPAAVNDPRPGKWRVVKMSGGSGMSIIAERGEALLEPTGKDRVGALDELSRTASEWAKAHPPAKLMVSREGDLLKVAAEGHGGHSSVPTSGHNALGDLTAFLATLDLRMDPWGALAAFTGNTVGTETDGRLLGLAHRDAVMGELTSNLSFLREDQGAPIAQINIRYPRGIAKDFMEKQLADRAAAFSRRTGATIGTDVNLTSEPHLAPAEGPLVSSLLAAWEEVTGTPGRPIAIGGGTQARLFPGGVDFGPAEAMETYRGHGTDEYLTPEELHRIAELTMAAVVRVAGR